MKSKTAKITPELKVTPLRVSPLRQWSTLHTQQTNYSQSPSAAKVIWGQPLYLRLNLGSGNLLKNKWKEASDRRFMFNVSINSDNLSSAHSEWTAVPLSQCFLWYGLKLEFTRASHHIVPLVVVCLVQVWIDSFRLCSSFCSQRAEHPGPLHVSDFSVCLAHIKPWPSLNVTTSNTPDHNLCRPERRHTGRLN